MDELQMIKFEEVHPDFIEVETLYLPSDFQTQVTELEVLTIPRSVDPLSDHDYILKDKSETKRKSSRKAKSTEPKEKKPKSVRNVRQSAFYSCKICGYSTLSKDTIERHWEVHKTITPGTKYEPCKKCNVNPKMLGYVICDKCGFYTKSEASLKLHNAKVHMKELPYKCVDCNYYGKDLKELIAHYKEHKPVKDFVCTICNFTTNLKKELWEHNSRHLEFMCNTCFFIAKDKSHLSVHMKEHETCVS